MLDYFILLVCGKTILQKIPAMSNTVMQLSIGRPTRSATLDHGVGKQAMEICIVTVDFA